MPYSYVTPRHKLVYNKEKCGNAYECLKCVDVTANKVGCLLPRLAEYPDAGTDGEAMGRYRLADHHIVHARLLRVRGMCEGLPKRSLELQKVDPGIPAVKVQRSDIVYCYTLKDGTKIMTRDTPKE